LSWNNPARLQLLELAEHLEWQAKAVELQNHPAERHKSPMGARGTEILQSFVGFTNNRSSARRAPKLCRGFQSNFMEARTGSVLWG